MKHQVNITIILLAMFVASQLIGIYVVDYYSPVKVIDGNVVEVGSPGLPFGLELPEAEKETDYYSFFSTIILAFILAITVFFLLTKFKIEFVLKIWFLLVIIIALSISFLSIFSLFVNYALIISIIVAFALAILKVYGRNFFVHNFTELLIYPGVAAVFVPLLNFWTVLALLLLISVYDMWAVWHSGIMQKMAKYQIDTLKVFSGFFVPYMSKKTRQKIKTWKKTLKKSELEKKKIKVNVAILGGGDVVFPIITSGVVLKTASMNLPFGLNPFLGGFWAANFVILGATLGLTYLFFFAEKKKFYPAMPFITVGILLGLLASYLIL